MDCKKCIHYSFKEMMMHGRPIWYAGKIPCSTCVHYTSGEDNFHPTGTADTKIFTVEDDGCGTAE